ncbi:DUF4229 domain-containing protein [Arthrobacter sp. H14-L1]|uniref:DUF4229 domain-containing protein n=1 Tax=Arthrobacter sp. H14-L1 TaxID=2996697 RepID=UPI00226FF7BC|nr:DUF4229 domain-containing protein [Arthrobacter sp. H14-L1]MCY0903985.1 DUF4229 domain-containing protein [Arthrobacter sp. H14-L1]
MAFFKYFLIRAGVFVPLLVLFLLLGMAPILAGIFAVLIAFCVSYLFFRPQREAAAEQLRNRFSANAKPIRSATELLDADAEDAMTDANPDVTVNADRRQKPPAAPTRKSNPMMPDAVPREFL